KSLGGKASTKRTARQTEDAQFWLITGPASYYPIARQLVAAEGMNVLDSARFMALASAAVADSFIAVFDAKYHYDFWRPITAIRKGHVDHNAPPGLGAPWPPTDNPPSHPKYPCPHSTSSASIATVIETVLETPNIPEVKMTSPPPPGPPPRGPNFGVYPD